MQVIGASVFSYPCNKYSSVQVTDVADAMILSQVFATLISHGVVLLSTSNWHPQHLYRDGLNRDNFLPTIDMLQVLSIPLPIICTQRRSHMCTVAENEQDNGDTLLN